MKKIAFIGSSGGNLFKQGGNDIQGMMKEILLQTRAAQMEVAAVQYILASSSLDTAGQDSPAKLYTWRDGELYLEKEGTLSQINDAALEEMRGNMRRAKAQMEAEGAARLLSALAFSKEVSAV